MDDLARLLLALAALVGGLFLTPRLAPAPPAWWDYPEHIAQAITQMAHGLASLSSTMVTAAEAVEALGSALVGEAEPLAWFAYPSIRTVEVRSGDGSVVHRYPVRAAMLSELTYEEVRDVLYPSRGYLSASEVREASELEPATVGDIWRQLLEDAPSGRFHYFGYDPAQAGHGEDGGTPMTLEELLAADEAMDEIDRRLEGES